MIDVPGMHGAVGDTPELSWEAAAAYNWLIFCHDRGMRPGPLGACRDTCFFEVAGVYACHVSSQYSSLERLY